MFIPRLLSGIVMLIIAFLGIYFGGWALWGIVLFLSIRGMFEMLRALGLHKKPISAAGYIIVLGFYLTVMPCIYPASNNVISLAVLVLGFLVIMTVYVFGFPKITSQEAFDTVVATIYPGVLLSFLYLIRTLDGGILLTWLIFIAAWGSDTFAYCTGMICKKFFTTHKMTPVLSPKKSVEGGIGGLVFAGILGAVYGLIFEKDITIFTISVPVACAIISVLGGMISMVGDLAASAVKRNHDIKDYGHLIPGHGGIMDRFDSIIFAAPCVYFLIVILQMIG